VVDTTTVLHYLSRAGLRWKLDSGRWQHPVRGIIVAHSGPLTEQQVLRVALLWGGPRAVLGGLTAAWLDGLKGYGDKLPFGERPVYLFVPPGRNARPGLDCIRVVVHQSRVLRSEDVHPVREPRRTRIARSLLDAAQWMQSDRGAMAVLAAGVQQGLVLAPQLAAAAAQMSRLRRRALIVGALADIEGGAQALSELDFTRLVVRRNRLPEPERQAARKDKQGRRRWIDVCWDEWKLMVEIDGAQHRDALSHWDDMNRDNCFMIDGYRVLRFPAWLVRDRPWEVAKQIRAALRQAGCRC
jgi:very-short-patch-repair endonuclease